MKVDVDRLLPMALALLCYAIHSSYATFCVVQRCLLDVLAVHFPVHLFALLCDVYCIFMILALTFISYVWFAEVHGGLINSTKSSLCNSIIYKSAWLVFFTYFTLEIKSGSAT